jgi:hypothetical protein
LARAFGAGAFGLAAAFPPAFGVDLGSAFAFGFDFVRAATMAFHPYVLARQHNAAGGKCSKQWC